MRNKKLPTFIFIVAVLFAIMCFIFIKISQYKSQETARKLEASLYERHESLRGFYWQKFYYNLEAALSSWGPYDYRGKNDTIYEAAMENGFSWDEISTIQESARLRYWELHPK